MFETVWNNKKQQHEIISKSLRPIIPLFVFGENVFCFKIQDGKNSLTINQNIIYEIKKGQCVNDNQYIFPLKDSIIQLNQIYKIKYKKLKQIVDFNHKESNVIQQLDWKNNNFFKK